MATNHTKNYKLNLWEPQDKFLREEFNENTQKLDAALAKKAESAALTALTQTVSKKAEAAALTQLSAVVSDKVRLVTGYYIGTGECGPEHPNVLEVPNAERPPRLVIVTEQGAARRTVLVHGITKTAVYTNDTAYYINVEWTNKGVKWWHPNDSLYQLNYKRSDGDFTYYYAIFI